MPETNFPKTQLKPYDGMAVTADIWSQAHEEHRQTAQAHNLSFHGAGIVAGLEVVANDPPDQYVFVSPGIAVDPAGNVIELTEPVAYDFGNTSEGVLYLLLGHGEREVGGVQKEIRYIQNEFVIAARPSMPKRPSVELARITISDPGDPVRNAKDPAHPAATELDLRFRKELPAAVKGPVRVAICNLGKNPPEAARGWNFLGQECQRSTEYRLVIDHKVIISDALADYDLAYIGVQGGFRNTNKIQNALIQFLDQGKMIMIEALDENAQESCRTLIENIGRGLNSITDQHPILADPFLFNAPPAGSSGSHILLDEQVIYSTAGYSLAWNGQAGDKQMERAQIRTAHEWGLNMLSYLLASENR